MLQIYFTVTAVIIFVLLKLSLGPYNYLRSAWTVCCIVNPVFLCLTCLSLLSLALLSVDFLSPTILWLCAVLFSAILIGLYRIFYQYKIFMSIKPCVFGEPLSFSTVMARDSLWEGVF